jgi:hypothetical protein
MSHREDPAERFERYRQSRQLIQGRDLAPPSDPIDYAGRYAAGGPGDLPYFAALAALVVLSTLVWAIWGMGAASPLILILGIALLAAWVLL